MLDAAVLTGVSHRHGDGPRARVVLHEVSFTVRRAEVVALSGRSGSGKTTLCHLVAGVMRPSAGEVVVDGSPALGLRDWRRVAMMPQRLTTLEGLTVRENALLPLRIHGRPTGAEAAADPGGELDELLDGLGLGEIADRLAIQTSLGEQQRVAIARALCLRPVLAVLDEPTGHQDDEHVQHVLAGLRQARDRGSALLIATHDPRVLDLADRVVPLQAAPR